MAAFYICQNYLIGMCIQSESENSYPFLYFHIMTNKAYFSFFFFLFNCHLLKNLGILNLFHAVKMKREACSIRGGVYPSKANAIIIDLTGYNLKVEFHFVFENINKTFWFFKQICALVPCTTFSIINPHYFQGLLSNRINIFFMALVFTKKQIPIPTKSKGANDEARTKEVKNETWYLGEVKFLLGMCEMMLVFSRSFKNICDYVVHRNGWGGCYSRVTRRFL